MNEFEKMMTEMDFRYFGTGRHLVDVESFLAGEDAFLLDVRTREEVETLKVNLSHHCPVLEIPTHEVPARLNEIPRDKMVGVFCSSGVRNVIVFAYLKSKGFDRVKILPGGYTTLTEALKPGKVFKKLNP